MNYFSIKTNDQRIISDIILKKLTTININRITWHFDDIKLNDYVFIIISGDESKKDFKYTNGLRAIGKVISKPLKASPNNKDFEFDIELSFIFDKSITKYDFHLFPDLLDAPNIGPETKGSPNQAIRKMDKITAESVVKAIIKLIPSYKLPLSTYFGITNLDIIQYSKEEKKISDEQKGNSMKFSTEQLNETNTTKKWIDFPYLNILFKGVPGTGKSFAVNNIIENFLNLNLNHNNVLRINIHSASSNSDLMQGIGISSNNDGNIIYNEKQGLILDIIKRATFNPNQPYVLVLEEIQENSLNELIGDLIYLIEDEKRSKLIADDSEYNSYEELVNQLVKDNKIKYYVKIPFLVSNQTEYRKMILPKNLFILCTSNYRDDKKIIEDNLLRRFEVIEIYPKNEITHEYVREFFDTLNQSIQKELKDEVHPDRFMIGHAIFRKVDNEKDFFRVLLKVVTEFKDVREIEFDTFKEIINNVTLPKKEDGTTNIIDLELANGYFELITQLQNEISYEFLEQ